ncbi:proteasome, subunit alpha/beta [Kipferlia bialata]|uniref:Proteasome subunit alpha type n=1 Tax=Kipferlia bialata TaxID=797122 RepID=A0A9K3D4L6_9EUKA|nr:proteasome, subunit alpha/beta [Kipferlia bialata]|eukprot:g11335.t1
MASLGAGYDLSVTTFSPDGRVFQVEYARKAADNSATIVAMRSDTGIGMAVEKPVLSKLIVPTSHRRIFYVDEKVVVGISGLLADGRVLVDRLRQEAQSFRWVYSRFV